MNKPSVFRYGEDKLTVTKALALVHREVKGILTDQTISKVKKSHAAVLRIVADGEAVYGINTGFGPLCTTRISDEETRLLQVNILKSHSSGVGEPISRNLSKLMMILKVHALAQGFSGISLETIQRILWHVDHELIPVVPCKGSVGASGDLAPLSHLFLPLIGHGFLWDKNRIVKARKLLKKHEQRPLDLGPKEGLALINGTQFILAHAVEGIDKMYNLLSHADLSGALMVESLLGSVSPFRKGLHDLRPFPGNEYVASRMESLLMQSEIVQSHLDCDRVQDPYSLRCIPQVHGSSRTAWLHLKELVEIELNAVTDNPVVLNAKQTISGGNFHGQPLALPLDYTCLAASELGSISERRTYLSLEGKTAGVPRLLIKETGINSGFMIPQYVAAALTSENKNLCMPASADSIPTSLGQEDHVSMGSISGRKFLEILENLKQILAIELLSAAQAQDFHAPMKPSPYLAKTVSVIREHVRHHKADTLFSEAIKKIAGLIEQRVLTEVLDGLKPAHYEQFEVY